MRGFLIVVACALATPTLAFAQRVQGPFQLGMSWDETQAAWPAPARRDDREAASGVRGPIYVAGTPFQPSLSFTDGALETVRYGREMDAANEDACAAEAIRIVMTLEGEAAFSGGVTGLEPLGGAPTITRTAGGSVVRSYAVDAAGNAFTYANRPGAVPAQVIGRYAAQVSDGPTCLVTLEYSRRPLPPAPGSIDSPSMAELAAAAPLADVRFIEQPSGQDFVHWYPPAALRDRIEGRVTLECLVRADGYLRCAVASEEPADAGFGDAAVHISARFRVEPQINGAPTAGKRVRRTIVFRLAS